MNKKQFSLLTLLFNFAFCLFTSTSYCQYYYNDILMNTQSNKNYEIMTSANVKLVTVTHFDNNDLLQNDLKIEQTFNKDWTILDSKTITADNVRPLLLKNY